MKKGIIEEIREYVKDPEHTGKYEYGKWGALSIFQRDKIHKLLDYAEYLEKLVDNHYETMVEMGVKE